MQRSRHHSLGVTDNRGKILEPDIELITGDAEAQLAPSQVHQLLRHESAVFSTSCIWREGRSSSSAGVQRQSKCAIPEKLVVALNSRGASLGRIGARDHG
jgi:hypothetical protein